MTFLRFWEPNDAGAAITMSPSPPSCALNVLPPSTRECQQAQAPLPWRVRNLHWEILALEILGFWNLEILSDMSPHTIDVLILVACSFLSELKKASVKDYEKRVYRKVL